MQKAKDSVEFTHTSHANLNDLADLLDANGKFLREYPACTYVVRETFRDIEKASKTITNQNAHAVLNQFAEFMEFKIWNSGSSVISSTLDLSTQKRFVAYIALRFQEMADLIRGGDFASYLANQEQWNSEFMTFQDAIRDASIREKHPKGADVRSVGTLEPWENKFLHLINKYGLFMEEKRPLFLLKSGYRSLYIFNPTHLVSRSNDTHSNKQILSSFREILADFFLGLKERLKVERISVVLTEKIGGEDPGTVLFASIFTELGIPTSIVDPIEEALKGSRDNKTPEVIFDGVTTTLSTPLEIKRKYSRITKKNPIAYVVTVNRSSADSVDGVPLISPAPRLLTPPEILRTSLATRDDGFDNWWPSLRLSHDHLRDVCQYYDKADSYNELRKEFEAVISKAYKIEAVMQNDHCRMLEGFEVDLSPSSLMTYLINLHVLFWNTMIETSFGDMISVEDDAPSYLRSMLQMEKRELLSLTILPNILKLELSKHDFPSMVGAFERIRRAFVYSTRNMLDIVKIKCSRFDLTSGKPEVELSLMISMANQALAARSKLLRNHDYPTDASQDAELRDGMVRDLRKIYRIRNS